MTTSIALTACTADLAARRVCRNDGSVVALTRLEAALLGHLAGRPGQAVARAELLREVWGYREGVRTETVEATVARLRRKIEADPRWPAHLRSVYGTGYRFDPLPARRAEDPGFVGRAAEVAAVEKAFDDGARLVTLTGTAGIGKTRLSRHVLHAWEPVSAFVPCEHARDPDALLAAAAAALRLDAPSALAASLAARDRWLLVLDNLEQVIEPAAALCASLLDAAPGLCILATSRERLRCPRERVIELGPLDAAAAGSLFSARAGELGATGLDDAEIGALVARLEGIPLALELAAARTRLLTPGEIARRLDRRLELLSVGPRGAPSRQATLRGAVAWSWDLLDAAERSALARCSVFEGPFPTEAAEGVLDLDGAPVLATIASLREKSLLRRGETGLLAPFAGVREFAAERLAEEGEAARHAAEARHARWFVQAAERAPLSRVARMEAELYAAVGRHLDRDPSLAASALLALEPIVRQRGPSEAWRRALDAAIDRRPPQRPRLRHLRGENLVAQGRVPEARDELAEARAEAADDAPTAALVCAGLAHLHMDLGEQDAAQSLLDEALALAGHDPLARRRVANARGRACSLRGDVPSAEIAFAEALELARAAQDEASAAVQLGNLGAMAHQRGELDLAEVRYRASIDLRLSSGGPLVVQAVRNYATLLLDRGRLEEAEALAHDALAAARENGVAPAVAYFLGVIGSVEAERALRADPSALVAAAHRLAEAVDTRSLPLDRAVVRFNLGCVLEARGLLDEARTQWVEARAGTFTDRRLRGLLATVLDADPGGDAEPVVRAVARLVSARRGATPLADTELAEARALATRSYDVRWQLLAWEASTSNRRRRPR